MKIIIVVYNYVEMLMELARTKFYISFDMDNSTEESVQMEAIAFKEHLPKDGVHFTCAPLRLFTH